MVDTKAAVEDVSVHRRILDGLVRYQAFVVPVIAVLLALAIGAILIAIQGVSPIVAYKSLFQSALLTETGQLRTLQKATPLILEGLAVAIAFKVGLFNIGAQGQLIIAAIGTAWAGYEFRSLPAVILIPAAIAVGMLLGAMWASLAALLKAYRGVHEVISTIMLNAIAAGIVDYLITGPLKEEGQAIPRTNAVAEWAMLPTFGVVPFGFFVALALAIFLSWVLKRTTLGFKLITVGQNRHAATYAGISYRGMVLVSMLISGALAGLGGSIEVLGVTGRYESSFAAGLGFDGITIALLARTNPLATIPAALIVGTLRAGANTLQFDTGIQPEVVDVLLAIILLLVSIPVLAKVLFGEKANTNHAVLGGWGS